MTTVTTETFFRPEETGRERVTIPALLYNRIRLMLTRCQYEHIFVPVRSMQFQAVIDDEEIIFVDNQAYAVRDGFGGRLILLAWEFEPALDREDLNEPVPIDLVYYHESAQELQKRIIGEFPKALDIMEARYKEHGCEPKSRKVLPFPGS